MNMYPNISLENLSLDQELARRLPRQLAYYHLALPIGIDDDGMTVVMAQPDNIKAHEIIQNAIGQTIIPVRAEADAIRQHLDYVWEVSLTAYWNTIAVQDDPMLGKYAQIFAEVYNSNVVDIEELPNGASSLHIQRLVTEIDLSYSTLLVQDHWQPIQHILQIVRLHSPDEKLLELLMPLSKHQDASLTLLVPKKVEWRVVHQLDKATNKMVESRVMTQVPSTNDDIIQLLDTQSKEGQLLLALRQKVEFAHVKAYVSLQQEEAVASILQFLKKHPHTLVAMAADAYGEYVHMVRRSLVHSEMLALLILKP